MAKIKVLEQDIPLIRVKDEEFQRLKERVQKLNKVAISQMKILLDDKTIKKLESK